MKDIVIKVLVVLLAVLSYFGVTEYLEIKELKENQLALEETIDNLNTQQAILEQTIRDLQEALDEEDDTEVSVDTCLKLYEITIRVISTDDNLDESVVHCTNAPTLGDALDELIDQLIVIYDPRYSKDYIYGRMCKSFYGVGVTVDEFYRITIEGDYSNYGVDKVNLTDNTSYEFTLVRWN